MWFVNRRYLSRKSSTRVRSSGTTFVFENRYYVQHRTLAVFGRHSGTFHERRKRVTISYHARLSTSARARRPLLTGHTLRLSAPMPNLRRRFGGQFQTVDETTIVPSATVPKMSAMSASVVVARDHPSPKLFTSIR